VGVRAFPILIDLTLPCSARPLQQPFLSPKQNIGSAGFRGIKDAGCDNGPPNRRGPWAIAHGGHGSEPALLVALLVPAIFIRVWSSN
jgi:hypothetical protein